MLPNSIDGIALQSEVEFRDYPSNTFIIDPATKQVRGCGDGLAATINDGHMNQQVLDAIIESHGSRKWISI